MVIMRKISSYLWSKEESRLRTFWRVLLAAFSGVLAVFIIPPLLLQGLKLPPSLNSLAINFFAAFTALVTAFIFSRYIDKRSLSDYGLKKGSRFKMDMVSGFVIGLIGLGVALGLDLLMGWATVVDIFSAGMAENSLSFWPSFLGFFAYFVFVAFWEELINRGIILTNTLEGFDSTPLSRKNAVIAALFVSSIIFSLLHFPGSILVFVYRVIMGLVLGAAYLWTDSLSLPIGLHLSVNFAMNNFWGLAAAGEGSENAPMLVRPEFTDVNLFTQVFGVANTAVILIIGFSMAGYIYYTQGSLKPRINSKYLSKED
jgi:membrane protease YdiL (CAAX protease family)